jgi:hypothetical protein
VTKNIDTLLILSNIFQLRMASALRKQGELGDAQDYCVEASRLGILSGDQGKFDHSLLLIYLLIYY